MPDSRRLIAMDMLQPRAGDVLLGKYRVERVLGKGGMGVVVAARHVELGELFAIKLLLPGVIPSDDADARFLREARASARLKGEHAARVHDVGRLEDGAPYMVMEHLEGTDLKALLAARGPLSIDEAIDYVLQASEAIAEAHELGIVHRDLKPANLFLTRRRSGAPLVKVLDFGIAKQLGPEIPGGDLTKTGALLGSPVYMSPEQIMHSREVDARTDIWSLGIVLYELLTGVVPFEGTTFPQLMAAVLGREPTPLRDKRPDAPASLAAVLDRCLRKEPAERFESIDALAAALRALPPGEREAPRPPMSSVPLPVKPEAPALSQDEQLARTSTQLVATRAPASVDMVETRSSGSKRSVVVVILAAAMLGVAGLVLAQRTTPPGLDQAPAASPQAHTAAAAPEIAATVPAPPAAPPPEPLAAPSPHVPEVPAKAAAPSTAAPRGARPPASAPPPSAAPSAKPAPVPASEQQQQRKHEGIF
ncbi:serine/threonine-protein kinase [Polyangium aurulentum]|uniref:serine/threonine-protein kinase n=1 Tax=Polyangium aurulentum TaxID=2567896 RepID=UPI0010AEAB77|nr:serine/threonine-protein kinase [Polyangium aurulentum]UQA56279.1 serine/threonine protein kinase [Polyangium aurulentum]